MTRQPAVAQRAEELLGVGVVSVSPVAGGDSSIATRLRLTDGSHALMKTHRAPPPGYFAAEASGLHWLAESGDVPVAEVLAVSEDALLLRWIDPGRATSEGASSFGAGLARLHAAGAASFGAPRDGFIGPLPMPNRPADSWPEFYATRRVLPYLKLARDRGRCTADEAAAVETVLPHLAGLVPEEPPARLHGDLWTGNVLAGADGAFHLIDPAAHGGHRETDLAMLALFGLPMLEAVFSSYDATVPLADGWRDRLGIHQLFPLLVHAAAFGGGYAARAAGIARHFSR